MKLAAPISQLGGRSSRSPGPTGVGPAAVACAALGVAAAVWAPPTALLPYRTVLLGSGVAVALLAVGFSFVVIGLAPYRSIAADVPVRQRRAAAATLLIALLPLAALLRSPLASARAGAAGLGLLLGAALLLLHAAAQHASPAQLIRSRVSAAALEEFLGRLAVRVEDELGEVDPREAAASRESPLSMHDVPLRVAARPRVDDPFEFLVQLCVAAMACSDTQTYRLAVDRALGAATAVSENKVGPGSGRGRHEVHAALRRHALAAVSRIEHATTASSASDVFAEHFVHAGLDRLRRAARDRAQTRELPLQVAALVSGTARVLLRRGARNAPLAALLTARRVTEQGIADLPPSSLENMHLDAYPDLIKGLGQQAVAAQDTAFLYRCVEALAWIAGTAIEGRSDRAALSAIQGLVQLGREARAAGLECFDPGCSLTPIEHVEERLDWVLGWATDVDEPARHEWLQTLGNAASRLGGRRVVLDLDESGSDPAIRVYRSGQAHTESFERNGQTRTVDYSDQGFTKDLRLR